jgi:hypothetical protein
VAVSAPAENGSGWTVDVVRSNNAITAFKVWAICASPA